MSEPKRRFGHTSRRHEHGTAPKNKVSTFHSAGKGRASRPEPLSIEKRKTKATVSAAQAVLRQRSRGNSTNATKQAQMPIVKTAAERAREAALKQMQYKRNEALSHIEFSEPVSPIRPENVPEEVKEIESVEIIEELPEAEKLVEEKEPTKRKEKKRGRFGSLFGFGRKKKSETSTDKEERDSNQSVDKLEELNEKTEVIQEEEEKQHTEIDTISPVKVDGDEEEEKKEQEETVTLITKEREEEEKEEREEEEKEQKEEKEEEPTIEEFTVEQEEDVVFAIPTDNLPEITKKSKETIVKKDIVEEVVPIQEEQSTTESLQSLPEETEEQEELEETPQISSSNSKLEEERAEKYFSSNPPDWTMPPSAWDGRSISSSESEEFFSGSENGGDAVDNSVRVTVDKKFKKVTPSDRDESPEPATYLRSKTDSINTATAVEHEFTQHVEHLLTQAKEKKNEKVELTVEEEAEKELEKEKQSIEVGLESLLRNKLSLRGTMMNSWRDLKAFAYLIRVPTFKKVYCDNCSSWIEHDYDEKRRATRMCMNCQKSYCVECTTMLHRKPQDRSHKRVIMNNVVTSGTKISRFLRACVVESAVERYKKCLVKRSQMVKDGAWVGYLGYYLNSDNADSADSENNSPSQEPQHTDSTLQYATDDIITPPLKLDQDGLQDVYDSFRHLTFQLPNPQDNPQIEKQEEEEEKEKEIIDDGLDNKWKNEESKVEKEVSEREGLLGFFSRFWGKEEDEKAEEKGTNDAAETDQVVRDEQVAKWLALEYDVDDLF